LNGYAQYYYLFPPIFEFQFVKYKHLQDKALVLFNEILKKEIETIRNESKVPIKKIKLNKKKIENEKCENIVAVKNSIIEEIIKIENIPLKVFWLYYANSIDDKFDFMIYNIIFVVFRKSGYTRDLELEIYEHHEYLSYGIYHSYNVNLEIRRYNLYNKIIKIPFFEKLFCHFRNLINESFKQVVEKLMLEVENNKYNFCYIQSGNNYLTNNKMEEILACL
ncbi:hypothetical protein COBT_000370, partial [Conglomerata obtusa]